MASMSIATLQPRCTTVQPATDAARRRRHAPCRARFATGSMAATLPVAAVTSAASAPLKTTTKSISTRSRASVASMWRQVQGSDDWAGLLQPLHPVLRDEVAMYGELVDACYAALDMDPSSSRYMCCKYGKDTVLDAAGITGRGYEVTRYIYATPDVWSTSWGGGRSSSSWVGYVAVSTDEMTRRLGRRDVLVALRGTETRAEWTANLMSSLTPARLHDGADDVKVESGFLNLYTSAAAGGMMGSCREQLLREVSRLVASFSDDDVSVTLAGHSMGSALALLFAYDLAELGLNRGAPVTVFSFGGPRVGNAAFKARCDALGVKALRVANVHDPITKLPGIFLNERTPRGLLLGGDCYTHVGVELALDFLRLRDLGSVHDLATYVASLRAEETGSCDRTNAAADGGGGVRAQGIVGFAAAY